MALWDSEEVRLFLGEVRRSSPHYAFYLVAIMCRLRVGELLALRWQDVDLANGTLTVGQKVYRLSGQLLFKEPKARSSRRTVAIPPSVVDAPAEVRREQDEARAMLGAVYEDRDLVFAQSTGKPLHLGNLRRRDFAAVSKRTKVPGLSRTTCATCASATWPLRECRYGWPWRGSAIAAPR